MNVKDLDILASALAREMRSEKKECLSFINEAFLTLGNDASPGLIYTTGKRLLITDRRRNHILSGTNSLRRRLELFRTAKKNNPHLTDKEIIKKINDEMLKKRKDAKRQGALLKETDLLYTPPLPYDETLNAGINNIEDYELYFSALQEIITARPELRATAEWYLYMVIYSSPPDREEKRAFATSRGIGTGIVEKEIFSIKELLGISIGGWL